MSHAVGLCPYCGITRPGLDFKVDFKSTAVLARRTRFWVIAACNSCGGVLACEVNGEGILSKTLIPKPEWDVVSEDVPDLPGEYLRQAKRSLNAPAAAIMVAASSVDAMLKEKGLEKGNLYERINQAASQHLITEGMKRWAHKVRLDANAQRHADKKVGLPTIEDAKSTVRFAEALAEFMFVLPAEVDRGEAATPSVSCNDRGDDPNG